MRGSDFNGYPGGWFEKAIRVLAAIGIGAIVGFAVLACAFIVQHLRFTP